MSAIAGIFHKDLRERVSSEALRELEDAIAFLGPDDGSSQALGPVGLVHRSLHTKASRPVSRQPLRSGTTWITFDGHLSNRDPLNRLFDGASQELPSDAALVLACYDKWGLKAFESIEGAFALSLWNPVTQQLLLVRDPMGIRQLFLRVDPKQYVWCTALEPLVLGAKRALTLNREHVYKLFTAQPCLDTTCYEEIFAVPPGMVVVLHPERTPMRRHYWSLSGGETLRLRSDGEYEEQFRFHLTRSISQHLQSQTSVTAELSGGLDSSTIVCVADCVCEDENRPLIETISYFDTDEPSGDERPYIGMVEHQRGKTGRHIGFADFRRLHRETELQPLSIPFQAAPGRFVHNLQRQSIIHGTLRQTGSRVLLSGMGGDEFLGGVPYGAPEIADHFCAYRFIPGAKSLLAWSIARQQTGRSCWKEARELFRARRYPASMLETSESSFPWLLRQPDGDAHAFAEFTDWQALTPSQLMYEWLRSKMASWRARSFVPLEELV